MRHKEMLLQMSKAKIRQKNPNKSIREQHQNTWKTTAKMHDDRIISMVKKRTFTTSNQVKDTLEDVGLSLSRPAIKRRIHEWKYSI